MVLAVIMAVSGALYSHSLLINDARGRQTVGGACVVGDLIGASNCSTTLTINRCRVAIPAVGGGTEEVPAYTLAGTCQNNQALYRP